MDRESIKNEALNRFRSDYNCSQSVLSSLAGELRLDVSLLEKVSSGFGGGMGHMQETCGAVTGSFMAISLYCGNKYDDNHRRTAEAYGMIKKFDALKKNNTVCFEIDEIVQIITSKDACEWGMKYQSVIGEGTAFFIENIDMKKKALDIIMKQYSVKNYQYFEKVLEKTAVIKVDVVSMTGKQSL